MDSTTREQALRDHFVVIESVRQGQLLEIKKRLSAHQIETNRLESLEKQWLELSKFDISVWMREEKTRLTQEELSESSDLYRKKMERMDAAHSVHIAAFEKYAWAGLGFILATVVFLADTQSSL